MANKTKNYVWDATIRRTVNGEEGDYPQGFGAPTLHKASLKAVKWMEENKIDGEIIALIKTENVVI